MARHEFVADPEHGQDVLVLIIDNDEGLRQLAAMTSGFLNEDGEVKNKDEYALTIRMAATRLDAESVRRREEAKNRGEAAHFRLPDGSGFAVLSLPLPKDHWLYKEGLDEPPAFMRTGTLNPKRKELTAHLREAAKYAVRASTMNGEETDFDPDAMVQNFVIAVLGYHTPDGNSHLTPPKQ